MVLALMAGHQDCQPYPNTGSQQQTLHLFLSDCQVTYHGCNANLLDCTRYLIQYLYHRP